MKLPGIVLLMFFLPWTVHASVVINEIAWMGTEVSPADEWIELRNLSSDPVDLSGWSLSSDDGSPSVSLSGVISAGGYFLIERTDDESVPGIAADLIAPFGNGLSNTGEILRLRDATGAVADTVDGSGDWGNIGGDNVTKETAQRTGSGWTTAPGTPRAENALPASPVAPASTETPSLTPPVSSTDTAISKPKSGPYPRENITVSAGEDLRAFSRMEMHLRGTALGLYDEELPYASYRWNFGDGVQALGKDVTHTFRFPGEYVVTLEVRHGDRVATDRLTAFITEPGVALVETVPGDSGYIALKNLSAREIDLSNWSLHADEKTFVFPPNSFILPGRTLKLANEMTGLRPAGGNAVLMLPGGALVAGGTQLSPTKTESLPETHTASSKTSVLASAPAASTEHPKASGANARVSPTPAEQAATVIWTREEPLEPSWRGKGEWLLTGAGLALLLGAGFLILRSHASEPTEAEEYAIIEDIIEGANESKQ